MTKTFCAQQVFVPTPSQNRSVALWPTLFPRGLDLPVGINDRLAEHGNPVFLVIGYEIVLNKLLGLESASTTIPFPPFSVTVLFSMSAPTPEEQTGIMSDETSFVDGLGE